MKTIAIMITVVLFFFSMFSHAEDLSELNSYLRKSIDWKCEVVGRETPLNIYFLDDNTGSQAAEVIVYVMNHAWERIGQESDLSILTDYIQKKFIVITVDFQNDPKAESPKFDKDLHDIFKAVYGYKTESLLDDIKLEPKRYRCFFLPEGYRVVTDLVYWDRKKYGAYGTPQWVMGTYNEHIVPKVDGLEAVQSPDEMVDRKGNPFDYRVKMDIVYPSQAKRKLPLIFYSATQAARNPNGQPKGYRPHMAGFTMRGYVYGLVGHCFNPCVNHYFHFIRFELDHWNGLACYTAAIRYLRKNSEQYFIDTNHIGGIGHSKGQYAITRLSDPNHEGLKESQRFKGFPEGSPQPQPWQGYSSRIHVGYQSMGMGTFEREYITTDYAPTIIACGENERDVISKDGHPKFVKRAEALDANHINLFMQGLAHEIPYGYDERMGVDRYLLMHDFFDRYLKTEEKLPPVVLVVSPRDKKEDVSSGENISVHFAPVIDKESIVRGEGIKVIRMKDSSPVNGSWKISHGGTKFTLTPQRPLNPGERYQIIVTTDVKDKAGTHMDKEISVQFIVAEQ